MTTHFAPLRPYAINFALSLPALIFFVDHVASLHTVRGRSMSPTLSPALSRDLILVSRWGVADNLRRGQVVLLRSPTNPETVAIKRVVGLEGDVIRTRRPYPVEVVTVPEGRVWVEGDEAFHSVDSNTYGPISAGLITARVTHVVFPPSRARRIKEDFEGRRGALVYRASD